MKQDNLLSVLQEIKALAEKALDGHREVLKTRVRKKPSTDSMTKGSLEDHILKLREAGFFKFPQTVDEIYQKLQSIYICDRVRVTTALWRLSQHKDLRKASKLVNKKKQAAYVW